MASAALFRDDEGNILVVKPTYRPEWLIPGGVVEEHESPRDACGREVREELGIDITVGRMLCLDYTRTLAEKTESLQFIFDGGVLTQTEIGRFRIQEVELEEYKFLSLEGAVTILNAKLAKRLPHCLAALRDGTTAYLEDGEP